MCLHGCVFLFTTCTLQILFVLQSYVVQTELFSNVWHPGQDVPCFVMYTHPYCTGVPILHPPYSTPYILSTNMCRAMVGISARMTHVHVMSPPSYFATPYCTLYVALPMFCAHTNVNGISARMSLAGPC